MTNLRIHGQAPYRVAVIHGGPGAAGEMAPVARRLAAAGGILEPLQTATSLDNQVEELQATLRSNGQLPVVLVGFSWGAWLSLIVAARHPETTHKLILVGSGPFEYRYVSTLHDTRLNRLNQAERSEFEDSLRALGNKSLVTKSEMLARLAALTAKTDQFDPIPDESTDCRVSICQADLFQSVWRDAAELRRSGELLRLAGQLRCPIFALHGDYDPHPAEGVREPLSRVVANFRFMPLEKCGHKPWIERHAREEFYRIIEAELWA